MLGDILFELSNDDRRRILFSLKEKPMRLTQISKNLGLTVQETSRQISRLEEVGLEYKDPKGFHHLTHYAELVLRQLRGIEFTSQFKYYFTAHSLERLSSDFVDGIGALSGSVGIGNAMDFVRVTDILIREAGDYVWLLVDQFPINSIRSIVEAIDRGVRFRIIELRERVLDPDLDALTSEETQAISRTRQTPLVEQRMVDEVDAYLLVSDKRGILAFPSSDGQFDFKGFTSTDDSSLSYYRDVFQHYWDGADQRTASPVARVVRGRVTSGLKTSNGIVVVGREDPGVDAQAVQDAVDNYDEVTLRGAFNFGPSFVQISKSVVIRGEGRENDIPSATIYKKGWRFPFTEWDCVFKLDREDANVVIENIHFTDFNHTCIWGSCCKKLNIINNRITLMTGSGRGLSFGSFGDVVVGIFVMPEVDAFEGKLNVKGNYIDLARIAWGGSLSRGGIEENPSYRPDLFNHEYYMTFGIAVHHGSDTVIIEDNIVRNANARGIAVTGNLETGDVTIRKNTVFSDVYGSYPFSSPEAGAGILVQSAWGFPSPGFELEISDNYIRLDKLNYSGIKVLGPVMDREGADKLRGGVVSGNRIQLKTGYEGIHVRKCDEFNLIRNTISGEAYYGIRVSGRKKTGELDLRALNNKVVDNDMKELEIRNPDVYSDGNVDGEMFAGSGGKSATANAWFNTHTSDNVIDIKVNETLIDEGTNNTRVRAQ
jgi:predicted transcriptional regulator